MMFSSLFSWLLYLLPNFDQQKVWHLKSQIDKYFFFVFFLHLLCGTIKDFVFSKIYLSHMNAA